MKKLLGLTIVATMLLTCTANAFATPRASDIAIEGENSGKEFFIADNAALLSSCNVEGERTQGTDEASMPDKQRDTVKEYICETVAIDENTYEIVKPDGEVVAICSMLQDEDAVNLAAENPSWSIDWTAAAGHRGYGSNRFNVFDGFTFFYNLKLSPAGDSYIGYYAVNENTYYWVHSASDSITAFITFLNNNYVSFAVKNNSDHTINYSGSYETMIFET